MKKNYFFIAFALLFATCAVPAFASDKDGCYSAGSCVSMTAKWKGDKFISSYTSNCKGRIYIRHCNGLTGNRSPHCGASGLMPGKKIYWGTFNNASGRYGAKWVGSEKGSNDWTCGGKVDGWRNDNDIL
ncbi:MAG: hypothetical protein ABFQ53_00335 [Patescibacteria group bacterium]